MNSVLLFDTNWHRCKAHAEVFSEQNIRLHVLKDNSIQDYQTGDPGACASAHYDLVLLHNNDRDSFERFSLAVSSQLRFDGASPILEQDGIPRVVSPDRPLQRQEII